jgi:hypothetical protein
MIGRNHKRLGIKMPAVAGAAGDLGRRVELAHVVLVDVLHHGEHHARSGLLRLGVVGKVEARTAVGPDVLGVGRVAGVAVPAQGAFPDFHDVAHLLPGQVLGQHFEVGRSGKRSRGSAAGWWARLGRLGNGNCSSEEARCDKSCRRAKGNVGKSLQVVFSWWGWRCFLG